MNVLELIDLMHEQTGVQKLYAERLIGFLFEEIRRQLECGEKVKIRGFGTFMRVRTKSRTAINPRTIEPVIIPSRYRYKWVPAETLRGKKRKPRK